MIHGTTARTANEKVTESGMAESTDSETDRGRVLRIRKMEPADIPSVASLERDIFSEPWSETGFADALAQRENLFLTAFRPDGGVIGYCGLYTAGDEGEITHVAVAENCRRQGTAAALLAELLGWARACGIIRIFLEVRISNEAAIRLYEKYGFETCGVRRGFYRRPTEDALLMSCAVCTQEDRNEKRRSCLL